MIKKIKSTLFFFCLFFLACANPKSEKPYPINTAYNLESALAKLQKTHPETKLVARSKNIKIWKNQVYKNLGYRNLSLDIYKSKAYLNKVQPAIVLIHGGGWSSGKPSMWYAMAENLAQLGYAAITVNYRLALEAPYPAAIYDVRDAVYWLKKNAQLYALDANFIALAGGSAGGQIASLVGLSTGDTKLDKHAKSASNTSSIQAIINIDGLSSLVTPLALKYENDRPQPSPLGQWLGGSFEQTPKLWREASPINYVNANSPPILFFKGNNPRFSAGIEEIRKKFAAYGIVNELEHYREAPHSFWLFDPWVKPMSKKIDEFLKTLTRD